MGIDPGLKCTGWAIVSSVSSALSLVDHGVVKTNYKADVHSKLLEIFSSLCEISKNNNVDVASIENVFVNTNPKASMFLCYGRCASILAMMVNKVKIFEYSPNTIKKCVFGSGHASKDQVAFMVNSSLYRPLSSNISSHETDAIGAAICHIYAMRHRHS